MYKRMERVYGIEGRRAREGMETRKADNEMNLSVLNELLLSVLSTEAPKTSVLESTDRGWGIDVEGGQSEEEVEGERRRKGRGRKKEETGRGGQRE